MTSQQSGEATRRSGLMSAIKVRVLLSISTRGRSANEKTGSLLLVQSGPCQLNTAIICLCWADGSPLHRVRPHSRGLLLTAMGALANTSPQTIRTRSSGESPEERIKFLKEPGLGKDKRLTQNRKTRKSLFIISA